MQLFVSTAKSQLLPLQTPIPTFSNPNPNLSKPSSFHGLLKLTTALLLRPPRATTTEQARSGSDIVPRRPVKESAEEGEEEAVTVQAVAESYEEEREEEVGVFGKSFEEIAKKLPIFEPQRTKGSKVGEVPPLPINLELGLYRAKVHTRHFEFVEAQKILLRCLSFWPEDGRVYVALGKLYSKQSKFTEARAVYEIGCQATHGENPYVWQCWAVLESKVGNIRRARELFDASVVADKKHVAAWHGWAVLELKQGNIKKARNLLAKGLKFCGKNEYIYQTLALLEARAQRFNQARLFFQQATECNPKSCASWLAWAQVEMQLDNNNMARELFEKAVKSSPKNRFAWQIWAMFEASQQNIDKARKLFKIGHALNPRDAVILQSLALLEYKYSTANVARALFRKASKVNPRHQPVWVAWGWMEWKEGNISIARELYQRALSIDATSESAALCFQAWGVLEQRIGNLAVARRLFKSSLNVDSQSQITWVTWAAMEEKQGNPERAEEIRNQYFQQRTEVVDDASWVNGFLDVIDPALDSIKKLLNLDQSMETQQDDSRGASAMEGSDGQGSEKTKDNPESDFDLDTFIEKNLLLNSSKLEAVLENSGLQRSNRRNRIWRSDQKVVPAQQ